MKKNILFVLTIILGIANYIFAQTADGGIFSNNNILTVKFKPSADITGAFTGGNFGIRWLSSLGAGINLNGETSSFGYVSQGPKATSGAYDYIIYASTSSIGSTTYSTGTEYTLMTVTVSGGSGTGSFELCPGGFAGDAGQWYIELGGADKANSDPALWYYAQSTDAVPLPIELASFSAKQAGSIINLSWQTKTEVNNYGFEIQRKVCNQNSGISNWEKIGFVQGNGNSNIPKEYQFIDKRLFGGSKFNYRLKQLDIDGHFIYSNELAVDAIPDKYDLLQNYPNPFNPTTNIDFQVLNPGLVTLKIYDIIGNEVATIVNRELESGFYKYQWNAKEMTSGIYFYRMTAGDYTAVKKMILLK